MHVAELWRYPVKSLQGEQLDAVPVTPDGLEGDRRYAIFDVETGLGLTARRLPELLFASARLRDDGLVDITLPDGTLARGDDALSTWLGRRVALRSSGAELTRRYESPIDFEDEARGAWERYPGAPGAFHDSPEARVTLVSTGTLGRWDRRRFRSNVLLQGDGEDALVGSRITLGGSVVEVGTRIARCVMTTRPQPDGIERDLDFLRTIARTRDACLAVGARVLSPGMVRLGDSIGAAATS